MKYVAAIASFLLASVQAPALAQLIISAPDGTNTGVNQAGNTFNITGGTQAGSNLFHSFQQFGLNAGQIANFLSNPAIANILGRVTGGDASIINGQIQVTGSNANLFLINPAGMIFGANASLNVPGSFTATTANAIGIGNNWFNAIGNNNYAALIGTPNSVAFLGTQPGAIVNAGNLAVGTGQSLTLLGGTVINTGTLTAPGGTITIAAVPGENLVRVTQDGSLLSLDLPLATKAILNPVTATPPSLPALLTGSNLGNATGVSVDANGVVRLTSSNTVIPSEAGTAIASNQLNAAGVTGGKVAVLGQKVGLVSATIDASGTHGGGTVLIGGDYQGKGIVPNAQQTYVSPDSVIRVDALQAGNGGRAIVWADGTTQFFGNISARGGTQSGNGGFVEVSGKENLTFNGFVEVTAANGRTGQLLLDPRSVYICADVSACPTADGFDINADTQLDDGQILASDGFPAANFLLTPAKILSMLATGNVSIAASRDIRVINPINAATSTNSLSLTAATVDIRESITLGGGNLTITAIDSSSGFIDYSADRIALKANLNTNGGDIVLTAPRIDLSANVDAGTAYPNPSGSVTFNAPVFFDNATLPLNDVFINGGNVTFNSTVNSSSAATPSNLQIRGSDVVFLGDVGSTNPVLNFAVSATNIFLKNVTAARLDVRATNDLNLETADSLLLNGAFPSFIQGKNVTLNVAGDLTLRNAYVNASSYGGDLLLTSQATLILDDVRFSYSSSGRDVRIEGQTVDILGNTKLVADRNLAVAAPTFNLQQSNIQAGGNVQIDATNLSVQTSRLQAGGDLSLKAQNTLQVQDAAATPAIAYAGGNLLLQGNSNIDIQALNNSQSFIYSGGNTNLVSNGNVTGNGRFLSEGNIALTTLAGTAGNLIYNPVSSNGIISANGDVTFNTYTGTSLKVEARGSITGGDITITGANTALTGTDPEIAILSNSGALILRAGLDTLQTTPNSLPNLAGLRNAPNTPQTIGTTNFTAGGGTSTPASITVGNVTTRGLVILSAPGNVMTGFIDAQNSTSPYFPASVTVTAGGSITAQQTNASGQLEPAPVSSVRSPVSLTAGSDILVGDIDTSGFGNPSFVKLSAGRDIQVNTIDTGAGGIDITAGGSFRAVSSLTNGFSSSGGILNDPALIDYLVGQGFDRTQLLSAGVRIPSANLRLSLISRPSTVPAGQLKSPIVIRYGDQKETIVDRAYSIDGTVSRFTILGDSQQPFRMGPVFDNNLQFIPNGADPLSAYNPVTNNFAFTFNTSRALVYGTSEFPASASGLAAGVATGEGTNSNLYGAFQNRVFDPVPKLVNPVMNNPDATNISNSGTTNTNSSTATATRVQTGDTGQVIQRRADDQAQNACNPVTTIASASSPEARSPGISKNPCALPQDDAQILRILGESPLK